jgi:hypothetical protein
MFSIPRSTDPLTGCPNNLTHGEQQFVTAGTFPFMVPEGVYMVWVSGVGGGAGGRAGDGVTAGQTGMMAIMTYDYPVKVSPGQVVSVTVGTGGAGGAGSSGNAGGSGNPSSFGSYVTMSGGAWVSDGLSGENNPACGYGGGGAGGTASGAGGTGKSGAVFVKW